MRGQGSGCSLDAAEPEERERPSGKVALPAQGRGPRWRDPTPSTRNGSLPSASLQVLQLPAILTLQAQREGKNTLAEFSQKKFRSPGREPRGGRPLRTRLQPLGRAGRAGRREKRVFGDSGRVLPLQCSQNTRWHQQRRCSFTHSSFWDTTDHPSPGSPAPEPGQC